MHGRANQYIQCGKVTNTLKRGTPPSNPARPLAQAVRALRPLRHRHHVKRQHPIINVIIPPRVEVRYGSAHATPVLRNIRSQLLDDAAPGAARLLKEGAEADVALRLVGDVRARRLHASDVLAVVVPPVICPGFHVSNCLLGGPSESQRTDG